MTHCFLKNWGDEQSKGKMDRDDRGRKRQQGTGCNTAECMGGKKFPAIFATESCLCTVYLCVCSHKRAHVDVHECV